LVGGHGEGRGGGLMSSKTLFVENVLGSGGNVGQNTRSPYKIRGLKAVQIRGGNFFN